MSLKCIIKTGLPQWQTGVCNWYFFTKPYEKEMLFCLHREDSNSNSYNVREAKVPFDKIGYYKERIEQFFKFFEVDGYKLSEKDMDQAYVGLANAKRILLKSGTTNK